MRRKGRSKFCKKAQERNGELPFKSFNCGRVGHYVKKYHFEEKKRFYKKKSIYSKQDNISSNESDGEEMESQEVLFIT